MQINEKLRQFNSWWDDFILEAIKPVAMLSMAMGTVAVFNLSGIAIQAWFVTAWAIVQAMSIDGLFFATWDRLFSSKRSWAMVGLALIGVVLAIVAIAINAVLGFQVLWAIGNSQVAMDKLGISSNLFTVVRAILAVTVFIMIAFVRSHTRVAIEEERSPIVARSRRRAITVESHSQATIAIEEERSPTVALPEQDSHIAIESVARSHKDMIKATWLRHIEEGRAINLKDIARDAQVGYSTVKKYAGKIRKEFNGLE